MIKIKDDVDLKELKKFGFYLEGNTYKKDVGKNNCIAICYIDRKILEPDLKRYNIKSKRKVENIIFNLAINGLVEKVGD